VEPVPGLRRNAGPGFEGSGGQPAWTGDVAHAAAILQVSVLWPRLLAWSAWRQTAASGPALHL